MPEPKIEVLKSYATESIQYTLQELKHELNNMIDNKEVTHLIVIGIAEKGRTMRFGSDDPDGMTNADILWYLKIAECDHLGIPIGKR